MVGMLPWRRDDADHLHGTLVNAFISCLGTFTCGFLGSQLKLGPSIAWAVGRESVSFAAAIVPNSARLASRAAPRARMRARAPLSAP